MADTFQIIIKKGPTPGRMVELTQDDITMGREASNSLQIEDRGLSRSHARLTRSGSGYNLQDLGSTNGTFVNGKAVSGVYALQNGDIISLGESVELEFHKITTGGDPNATFVMPAPQMKSDATEVLPSRAALQAELNKGSKNLADSHRRSCWSWKVHCR